MCAIAGIVGATPEEQAGLINAMLLQMAHRGPDGTGEFFDEISHTVVGMSRLAIVDVQGGSQPIWNETRTICVICNGEIYNFPELRDELKARGHHLRTNSDVEVLVHLYEDYGDETPTRLRGMFSAAILDVKAQRLLLFRDHFGQKPLYISQAAGRLAFASEAKALLVLPWIDPSIDEAAFFEYAAWNSLAPGRSHFKHIRKLKAGSSLLVDLATGAVVEERYFLYTDHKHQAALSEDEAVEQLHAALSLSVRSHLQSDVPVGVLLSGGLDSAAILTYANAASGASLPAYSVGFEGGDDEIEAAAFTAAELGSEHRWIRLRPSDLANSIDQVACLLDEPVGDPACFALLRLCEYARKQVTVLLSGEGSDELFAGYSTRYDGMLQTMERTERYRWLGRALGRVGMETASDRVSRLVARSRMTPGEEVARLRMEGLPGDVRYPRGFSRSQQVDIYAKASLLGDQVFRKQTSQFSSLLAFDIDWQLAEGLLQKADKMSMGASVELRAPFLDQSVATVARTLPNSLRLKRRGQGKLVLRKTLRRKHRGKGNQPKIGFGLPLASWLRQPLREEVEQDLFASRGVLSSLLEPRQLRTAWNEFLAGWDAPTVFYALWLYARWHRLSTSPRQA